MRKTLRRAPLMGLVLTSQGLVPEVSWETKFQSTPGHKALLAGLLKQSIVVNIIIRLFFCKEKVALRGKPKCS